MGFSSGGSAGGPGGLDLTLPPVGHWLGQQNVPAVNGSSRTLNDGYFYAVPVYFPAACPIDRFGIQVVTAMAGNLMRFGIYAMNDRGRPSDLLYEAPSDVALDATGLKEVIVSYTVPKGWNAIATLTHGVNGAAVAGISENYSLPWLGRATPIGTPTLGYLRALAAGTTRLPATYGAADQAEILHRPYVRVA